MPRIANVSTRELLRLLRRMRFSRHNRHHAYFYHEWLSVTTHISHGDRDIGAALMGDIAIKQLKMNSAEEFRAALRGDIPQLPGPRCAVGRPTAGLEDVCGSGWAV